MTTAIHEEAEMVQEGMDMAIVVVAAEVVEVATVGCERTLEAPPAQGQDED